MAHLDHHYPVLRTLQSIRTPRIMRAVGALLTIGVGAVIGFLVFMPWVQTTAGAGVVTALNPNDRLQQINALVSGRIDEWYVRDGSIVKAGDPILKIVDNDPRLIERLEAERAQVIARKEATLAALATAEIDLRRMQDLYGKGLAARRECEQAQIAVQNLRGRVAAFEARIAEANYSSIPLDLGTLELEEAPDR